MEYNKEFDKEFDKEFMRRTLNLLKEYKGSYDATLLINCLLGLLVIPKEKYFNGLPIDTIDESKKWGISPKSIIAFARVTNQNQYPETLRGIVYNLRNSVAHFRIEPVHESNEVCSFKFTDSNGFHADIPVGEIICLVEELVGHLLHGEEI